MAIREYHLRPEAESLPEQKYLRALVIQIEKNLGKVAARLGEPVTLSQPLDALDRARELTNDMMKQVRVRPLEEAVASQKAWLDRAQANLDASNGEPKNDMNKIELDQRLLDEILAGWQVSRN